MENKWCFKCNSELNLYAEKCPDCGSTSFTDQAPAHVFCVNCGTQVPDIAVFCPSCGSKIIRANAATASQPVYQQPVYTQPVQQQPVYAPQPQQLQHADLVRKPYFYFVAAAFALLGFWTGSYGYGALSKSYCSQVAFNSDQVFSFTNAFICVNDFNYELVDALNAPIYSKGPFVVVMIAVSFFLWTIAWRFVSKARGAV